VRARTGVKSGDIEMIRIGWLIALTLCLCGCAGHQGMVRSTPQADPPAVVPTVDRPVEFVEDEELLGMRMVLREAGAPSADTTGVPRAEGTVLTDGEVEALLVRVAALESEGDREAFAVREGSLPPPLTGETVDLPFPPTDMALLPDAGEPGQLEILRAAPEGDVPMAPHLSVTFSRPMVAVTSQAEAAAQMPVQLEPRPDGSWRWLGTRTALYQPDGRFPMATDYRVTIPAGTPSATGETLAEDRSFGFSTPAVGLQRGYPTDGPHGLEPVILVQFDQRIDVDAILPFIRVSAARHDHPVRLASDDEVKADEGARRFRDQSAEGRWLALKTVDPLPAAETIQVVVRQGAPSAEGAKLTPGDQSFTFFTYEPLRVVSHRCGHRSCPPNASWTVEFNNPLDAEGELPAIVVEPEITGQRVQLFGKRLTIEGIKRGRTLYKARIPAETRDTFGQTLGEEKVLTFNVGPANPTLFGPGKDLVTLDPTAPPAFSVYSTNHERLLVEVHRVVPEQWSEWASWRRSYRYDNANPPAMPGERLSRTKVDVDGGADALTETAIDLQPYLPEGVGHLLVRIQPVKQPKERWQRQEVLAWVQATELGLAAFTDASELVAWVTTLEQGAAVADAELMILPGGEPRGTSDEQGLARLALIAEPKGPQVLTARRGDDVAMLPQSASWWNDHAAWRKLERKDQLRWYTLDDRGLYRPGERVHVKGFIRLFQPGEGGDVQGLDGTPSRVSWQLRGPRGNDLASGEATVSSLGGLDLEFDLPDDVNLGTAYLKLNAVDPGGLDRDQHNHPIRIQEFRRPEFEVGTSTEEAPFVLGEETVVSVEAAYYAGGGLAGAPVHWVVTASPGHFTPPNQSDYQFGAWRPWWWHRPAETSGHGAESLEGSTDPLGQHHLGIHFQSMNPPRPMTVRAEARVTDVNRQAWTASSTMLVHPAALYVGLRADRGFLAKGDPAEIGAVVADLDGERVSGVQVSMTMVRLDWAYKGGKWIEEEVDPQTCQVTSDQEERSCTFEPMMGGAYRVTAEIHDGDGRLNRSEVRFWVAGGERPPARDVEREQITLIPERQEYQPGETATFLVQAPFYPADGLLTVRRSGLVRTEPFRLEEPTTTLSVPIVEGFIPDVTVQVDLVGSAIRADDKGEPRDDLPRRVAYANGSLTFQVPPLQRALSVTAAPREPALEPGDATEILVAVADASGNAVAGAEVAGVVVDEAVLALTGYQLPDPLEVFYAARGAGVADYHQRSQVVLADPMALRELADSAAANMDNNPLETMSVSNTSGAVRSRSAGARRGDAAAPPKAMEPMAYADDDGEADDWGVSPDEPMDSGRANKKGGSAPPEPAIDVRTDFSALALFAPQEATGDDGTVTVAVTVPDSLTRYRVMVVAVAGGQQFGSGESAITARLPMMVRPSPPRFLNFGDRFELSMVVQNQTEAPLDVSLAVRATNVSLAATLAEAVPGTGDGGPQSAGRRVTVPANDRIEVRFPAAAQMAGTARFQAVAAAGSHADAATFQLPVWTPATSEAFATYGQIDDGALVQPVLAPADVWPQFGGLEITTSSTQLQSLTDAVLYLVSYPYDCNEQIASRVLAIAALQDVLEAFEAEQLPPADELRATVAGDLARLQKRQNNDGGFAFWRKGDESWPYLSIHAAHAMSRAAEKGHEVDSRMWTRSGRYLQRIERHIPSWYSQESKWSLRAYALSVRLRMDDVDVSKAKKLLAEAEVDKLPMEAQGWILPVLQAGGAESQVAEIQHYLANHVAESAAGAHFVTGYSDGAHVLLHSDRRVDGIVLESLIAVDPDSDLIPKLVAGLLDHRKRGRWSNTQENVFILLALDRYFHVYEGVTPDFVARAWLGETFAGEHEFRGRTTERAHIGIPMGYLTETEGEQPLTLHKDGAGRLYYRIGMRYAPRDLDLEAADYGFAVERVYEAVDDDGDVSRHEDGSWHVKAGARVRVRLTMVAPMRRYHVALVDPLPAGLEPINPELALSEALPADPQQKERADRYWWWWRPWYEHENMRDERVEAFTSLLWDGVHTYTYVARATTPGEFVVPPAKAEEMYHPETYGRTGTDRLVVE